jgi:hypothetical protein
MIATIRWRGWRWAVVASGDPSSGETPLHTALCGRSRRLACPAPSVLRGPTRWQNLGQIVQVLQACCCCAGWRCWPSSLPSGGFLMYAPLLVWRCVKWLRRHSFQWSGFLTLCSGHAGNRGGRAAWREKNILRTENKCGTNIPQPKVLDSPLPVPARIRHKEPPYVRSRPAYCRRFFHG